MSNKNDIIEELIDELNKVNFDGISQYNGRECTLDASTNTPLITYIKAAFNNPEELPGNKISFLLTDSKWQEVLYYYDETDFINRCKLDIEEYQDKYIVFLNPLGTLNTRQVTLADTEKFAINFLTYKSLRELFKETKELSQFKNETSKTFTIVSKEYGVFHVGYTLPEYLYFYNINISDKFERLKKEFEKKEFIQFFKEIIVTSVHSADEKNRFNVIISQLDSIIDLALKDYEAYVSNFAIDKIKSDFKKERESYFESIDRSISSIGKQVVAFPLTFAASVFASYKVQDKPGVLLLILLAYLLYTIVAYLILTMTAYNVRCLRKDVKLEEKAIKNSYGKIYADFKTDFDKIKNKICLLRIVVGVLYGVLTILFVLFTLYAAHSMHWLDLSSWVTWVPEKT
ncbi:hypothetical protein [uncultured Maribacter sp.]|uniref:hypothetical protein n=1 Tax=uncultured Maribacter sp. TaxID=431308 RepID=UPI0030EB56F3|tara:strand:- start:57538 stop:58740 length:1203 start_codon:yes stop_codon:yes gene_type:complete